MPTTIAAVLGSCLVASLAPGEPTGDAPVLGGPAVVEAETGPTLVRLGYDGRLERLDAPPEEAALELLELAPALQATVDAYLGERAAAWDAWVSANYTEILAARSASHGGGEEGRRVRQSQTRKLMQDSPLATMGTLAEGLEDVLPPDVHEEVVALSDAYRAALAEDQANDPTANRTPGAAPGGMREGAPGDASPRERGRRGNTDRRNAGGRMAAFRARIDEATTELRRALDRTLGQASADFEDLIREAGLSPEGEALVRKRVQEFRSNAAGAPGGAGAPGTARAARGQSGAFMGILNELGPEDRAGLIAALRARGAGMGKAPD